jgi:pimeloyl-ACP methyl ester carboxylesterase
MDSFYIPRLDAFMRYHDRPGEGPTCVYLHGLGCASSSDFVGVVAQPSLAHRRAVLVDLLGFGFSDRPEEFDYTAESQARTVAELLDHLALSDCNLIGQSMGGAIAMVVASLRPELVSRLVAAEGNLDPGGGRFSQPIAAQTEPDFLQGGYDEFLRRIRSEGELGDTSMLAYAGSLQVCAPHALYRAAVALVKGSQPTWRERLLALTMPRVYVFGERSLPNPDQDRLTQAGVRVLVVPEAGHSMMLDNPAGFADVLSLALA